MNLGRCKKGTALVSIVRCDGAVTTCLKWIVVSDNVRNDGCRSRLEIFTPKSQTLSLSFDSPFVAWDSSVKIIVRVDCGGVSGLG